MRKPNGVVMLAIGALATLASCYRPTTEAACGVGCTFAEHGGACPAGLTCFDSPSGGVCRTETDRCSDVVHDAPGSSDAGFCYGSVDGIIHGCTAAAPTTSRADLTTINTSPGSADCMTLPQNADDKDDVCAIFAVDFTFAAPIIAARGSRPLVLIASQDITIASTNTLTVANTRARSDAAGSGSSHCQSPGTPKPAAGGAGGSFHGLGGAGGGANGVATSPASTAPDKILRGGCPGGDGDGSPVTAGKGGGAIYLIAGRRLTIAGTINASGSGASFVTSGGSGGGSGGMIGLDAPEINVTGVLMANGGGGSSGGPTSAFGGDPVSPEIAAAGGPGAAPGGDGSAGVQLDGMGANSVTGAGLTAGGGGGGAGYIAVFPEDQRQKIPLAMVSPSPSD